MLVVRETDTLRVETKGNCTSLQGQRSFLCGSLIKADKCAKYTNLQRKKLQITFKTEQYETKKNTIF